MRAILLIVVFTALCLAILPGDIVELNENSFVVTKSKVDRINSIEGNTWKASTNQGSTISSITVGEIRKFLGYREGGPQLDEKVEFEVEASDVPDTFDSREHWPDCPTIKNIRDQSACGSCWAFGAGEAISDRYCTYGVNKNLSVATADIGFCCGSSCGYGCEGGFPSAAFQYWLKKGVVSEQCYPYPFPSCDHHVPNSKNPCPSDIYPTPKCPNKCSNGDSWSNSKHFASKAYTVSSGEKAIQQEIFANGPVETAFTVYDDFPTYKSGVYKRTSSRALGGHAVKFVGWGTENGVKYWLVANSWNPNWGDQGYFKILRGKNECGIENQVWAGVPKN